MIDRALSYARDGAVHFPRAVSSSLVELYEALAHVAEGHAGVRLSGVEALRPLLSTDGALGRIAASVIGAKCRAVRAILFDKTASTNWALGWHQDRTICVKQRIDVDGFGPWTTKAGLQHVAPPFDLLAHMVTLRVHFDPVPANNAPLLIAPGSHLRGRVPENTIRDVVRQCGTHICLAAPGDVWLYATPILHASEAASVPMHRRVLQLDFSADVLPGGLEWLGI